MARRRREYKRPVTQDARFGEQVIGKFINCMMWHGKKTLSETMFYGALDLIDERQNDKGPEEPKGLQVFHRAMDNVRPLVEVRSRRVGGATYQVPTEVRPSRQDALAIRWIISNARERSEKSMTHRLAGEFMDAAQNRGNAVKKKEETHRMAEANRAFAHYRW